MGCGVVDDTDVSDGDKIGFSIHNCTDQNRRSGIEDVNSAEVFLHYIISFSMCVRYKLSAIFMIKVSL